ncbi:MAG: hypothetical protein RIQ94_499, partial [Pseudomonadota bacterium]
MYPLFKLLIILLLISPSSNATNSLLVVKANPILLKKLKIIAIGEGEVHDSFRLPARIDLDQQHVARIGTTVTGRIIETEAVLGQEVRKGEKLATLNSTELGLAQSAYLKTNAQVNLKRLVVNRAQRLMDSGIIAAANIQERETMLAEAEVDLRTATDQLRALGMSNDDLARLSKEKKIHSILPITT